MDGPPFQLHAGYWPDPDGLLAAVRACFTYPQGEKRATGYVYGDTDWPDPLAWMGPALLDALYFTLGCRLTHVCFQAYADGTAGCDWHADTSFDGQAIVSLGAARSFGLRRPDGSGERYFTVEHGDLVWMPHGFQTHWQHRIKPNAGVTAERCSLVFRDNHRSA